METKVKTFRREEYSKSDSSFAFLLASILPLIFLFVLLFVVSIFGDLKTIQNELWYLILTALVSQVSFLIIAIFINKTEKINSKALKIQKISIKNVIFSILVAVICFFGMYNFIDLINFILSKVGYNLSSTSLPLTNAGELVLNLFLLGVLPAVLEEIIFRGIIFQGLRKEHNNLSAVFYSAFLFAIIHGSLAQFVYPFVMGIVLAMLFLRTGSLLASMTAHLTNNFLVIIFSYIQNRTGFSLSIGMSALGVVLAILIAVCAFGILYLIDKFVYKQKIKSGFEVEVMPSGKKNIVMGFAIGIAVVLFLVNTISAFI